MAKQKKPTPKSAPLANRGDQPGNEEQASSPPRPKRRRTRSWEIEMILCDEIQPLEGHLLTGLSLEEREQARWSALGNVLASIAKRRASQQDQPEGPLNGKGQQNENQDAE